MPAATAAQVYLVWAVHTDIKHPRESGVRFARLDRLGKHLRVLRLCIC